MGVPTAEEIAEVLKICKEQDGGSASSEVCAAATLAEWVKWKYEVESLWRIDSILQMIEAGNEPDINIVLRKGFPATH